MGVSVLDLVGQIVYYPDMASIVGKKRGNKTYYYLVTSARVDGRPRIVDQQYLGSAEEVMARLLGSTAGAPERTQHKKFGDLAAVWGILERLGVIEAIDEVCGPRRADAGASVGTYLALATLNRVVAPCSKLGFAHWWATTAGPRFTKVPVSATDHRRFWDAMDALDTAKLATAACSTAATIRTVLGGAAAGVGVAGGRDPTVAGHDQGEPDQAQVIALLLGVAPLGDRGPVVARVDERGEVRHVQREAGQVQAELGDHRLADRPLRGRELGGVQRVHRIPEPAVVRRADGNLREPRPCRGGPPVRESELRARGDDPVQRGQRQV